MQLLFYKIKENVEQKFKGIPVDKLIDKIILICENGEIKNTELVIKE